MAKEQTLGDAFKSICFYGLNKVEYLPEKGEDSIFADAWQDVTDEQSRRSMALCFVAPRDLDGEPVNPYVFLSDQDDMEDEHDVYMAQQSFGDMPILDFSRFGGRAEANSVSFVVAADAIFHWDGNDSYIQPTGQQTWVRDLQQLIKSYPRTSKKIVYTEWDSANKLEELKVEKYSLRDIPLDEDVWLNMPTFQEKYGMHMLVASILVALGIWGLQYQQGKTIDNLNRQIRVVEDSAARGINFTEMDRILAEQEGQMRFRTLMPLLFRDVANAIQAADMQIDEFEIRNPNPQTPPDALIANIVAEKDAYKGWLQEEPIAKAVLTKSSTLKAIRKPPGGNRLKLEGFIDLFEVEEKVADYRQKAKRENKSLDFGAGDINPLVEPQTNGGDSS